MPDQLNIIIDDQEGDVLSSGDPKAWIRSASKKWMSQLPDDTKLSNMSIPGTHDAATSVYRGGMAGVVTQEWTIKQQLEAGIRWFDLRLRRSEDCKFALQHGDYYLGIELDDLLEDVKAFLADNPTEGILFHYQYQGSADDNCSLGNDDVWDVYLNKYSFLKRTYNVKKNLGDIRGKMVQLTCDDIYNSGNTGRYEDYYQNHYAVYFFDHYLSIENKESAVSVPQKVEFARQNLAKAIESDEDQWFLNSLSGATGMLPHDVSRYTMPAIYKEIGKSLKCTNYTKLGLIQMDYPGEKMIGRIIKSNFIPSDNCRTIFYVDNNHDAIVQTEKEFTIIPSHVKISLTTGAKVNDYKGINVFGVNNMVFELKINGGEHGPKELIIASPFLGDSFEVEFIEAKMFGVHTGVGTKTFTTADLVEKEINFHWQNE